MRLSMAFKICFIGAGNMARAIAQGLLNTGFAPADLVLAGPRQEALAPLAQDWGVAVTTDNRAACAGAQVVILAVKPQLMAQVCQGLQGAVAADALVISVAAGIRLSSLQHWLGGHGALVRAMPNTPAQIGAGATGVFGLGLSAEQVERTELILKAVGHVHWVEQESLIDTVTAVSGSGPAYFFYFMEAMVEAAVAQGLSEPVARALAQQTALGAAQLAMAAPESLAQLRRRVTSPKGTTEQAILAFEAGGLPQLVATAMRACQARAKTLADEWGG
jgi:pyrroline-5-carboxylate reductase